MRVHRGVTTFVMASDPIHVAERALCGCVSIKAGVGWAAEVLTPSGLQVSDGIKRSLKVCGFLGHGEGE